MSRFLTTSLALLLLLSSLVHARQDYAKLVPNGLAGFSVNTGITCKYLGHTQCQPGTARNSFGLDFAAANRKWTKALCMKDSDGDGLTNGEELGDPCCKWSVGKTPERTTMLSHPGDIDETNSAPKCKSGSGGGGSGQPGTPPGTRPPPTTAMGPSSGGRGMAANCGATFFPKRAPLCKPVFQGRGGSPSVRYFVTMSTESMKFKVNIALFTRSGPQRVVTKVSMKVGGMTRMFNYRNKKPNVVYRYPIFLRSLPKPNGRPHCCGPANKIPFNIEISFCARNGKMCGTVGGNGAATIKCGDVCNGKKGMRVLMSGKIKCPSCKT